MRSFKLGLMTAAIGALCAASGATAARAQDFYAGKTLTIICWSGAGSLYDTNARFVGRHLARLLPGKPDVVVRNMPGGGGVIATNHIANTAPKDGTTIGIVARGMGIEPLLGGESARFDPLTLNWIGSTSPEVSVIAVRSETGVKSLDDARRIEVALAGPAPGSDGVTFPNTLNNLLGTKFKIVTGYRSGPEMVLAVERREVDGRGSWSWAAFRTEGMPMLKKGQLSILVQLAPRKSPELPDVPLVMDYAKTEQERQILEFVIAGQTMAWPFVAPAETPKERVDLLRKTFSAMLKAPEVVAEAAKLGVDIDPVTGDEIDALLKRIYATPPTVIEKIRDLTGRQTRN